MPESVNITNAKVDFCDCLVHPFQDDPGVSQLQRVMDDLLSGNAKIDARKTADLLNYFYQLSRNINYYDSNLNVSDWQPFFEKSVPFALATLIKYDADAVTEKFNFYKALFDKQPSASGLQLAIFFVYYNSIKSINDWYGKIKGNDLPVQRVMESIIKDKLQKPLTDFIVTTLLAQKWVCVKKIDFTAFGENDIWKVPSIQDLIKKFNVADSKYLTWGKSKRLIELHNAVLDTFSSFSEAIKILPAIAEDSLEQSLFPLKEEFQKNHEPHLGLLFAFLKLFEKLQGDLNTLTKKHLDFFYKEVLKIKPKPAVADNVHIVFEIQKELKNYLLRKDLKVKDGKDINKQDILFSLDDEIVVNKAKVTDTRTLFLNNQIIPNPADGSKNVALLEGVYMAPNATTADGVDKDFQTDVTNFYTVGNKESKYILPGTTEFQPYPNARLGFILASPVLLLNEGNRTVTIKLDCKLDEQICNELAKLSYPLLKPCCGHLPAQTVLPNIPENIYAEFFTLNDPLNNLYSKISDALNTSYYYVSEDLIQQLITKGISNQVVDVLRGYLTSSDSVKPDKNNPHPPKPYCYCPHEKKKFDAIVDAKNFEDDLDLNNPDKPPAESILELFRKRKPLKLSFSGDTEWIETNKDKQVSFEILPGTYAARFTLKITAVLTPELKAVTFYNKENLKEDFDTTLPLVKIELDDHYKLDYSPGEVINSCCLERALPDINLPVSLYHFFRNVKIEKNTSINVKVCDLKTFIVQNDESVLDVNNPFPPFGTRPEIIDSNVVNPTVCITQELIDDAELSTPGKKAMDKLIKQSSDKKIRVSKKALLSFFSSNSIDAEDQSKIIARLNDKTKNYCGSNLIGPNFYLGAKEVFCKKWEEVYINFNWKDKPSDFRDYYKGYIAKVNPQSPDNFIYGLDQDEFQINLSVLKDGKWIRESSHKKPSDPDSTTLNHKTHTNNRKLFPADEPGKVPWCLVHSEKKPLPFEQNIHLTKEYFFDTGLNFEIDSNPVLKYDINSRKGFIKINLQNQDFLHKDYPYVLARQMMALGGLPDKHIDDAVYYDQNGGIVVFDSGTFSGTFREKFEAAEILAGEIDADINEDDSEGKGIKAIVGDPHHSAAADAEKTAKNPEAKKTDKRIEEIQKIIFPDKKDHTGSEPYIEGGKNLTNKTANLVDALDDILKAIDPIEQDTNKTFQAIIPLQPWTPAISTISIDYTATATLTDIDLIHLYPFDGTYKHEEIDRKPTLFATFCDEGTLYLGVENLVPGNNLNILFQLAEATADSESEEEDALWYYLDNNIWKPLRAGFEVMDDATENLTTSGIIKFALPENMTNQNSVMPKNLHWIKATIPQNSASVSETIGIFTQAIRATFTNDAANDTSRLIAPLGAGQVSKLDVADASVSSVIQPYDSFNGQVSEDKGMFYVRVSELLRHKGRAIQKFDYERIVLDAFPQVFKAKCINHSFGLNAHIYKNDFPYAPGYVLMAVIPDLFKLKGGNAIGPKVPVSILEKIDAYIRLRTSPFVRFRAMNPRYEQIHLCLTIKLMPGKDEQYYKDKVKEDLSEFISPWLVGDYYSYKLGFGQCVNRSVIISFLERLDYVDFILALNMRHEDDANFETAESKIPIQICPKTPRSILVAGDIDVCIDPEACPQWEYCYEDDKQTKKDCCDSVIEKIIDHCEPPGNDNQATRR